MKYQKVITLSLFTIILFGSCKSQTENQRNRLSQDFDKESPIFYAMPNHLSNIDYSPAWEKEGQKIVIKGTIYHQDKKTPASDVLLYYYQTDTDGRYTHNPLVKRSLPQNALGQTHGYIRGWIKTDASGEYSIYTIRPGSYPSRNEPEHIHFTISEKNMDEPYYIDDILFDDDPLLTTEQRNRLSLRGGNGVVTLQPKDNILEGRRDIILGMNIPNYPKN